MNRLIIYILFFISGICGLIYELIWQRQLTLIVGNTIYATSAILSAFMGGLALGSFVFGRFVDREKKPLRIYCILEVGIAISALAILFLFLPISNYLYIWVFRHLGQNTFLLNLTRFLLPLLILIIPTTLMGGTLPVISKYIIRQSENFGLRIGDLYALNTVGGVFGAFLTGFYFIRLFGETATTWLAIGGNFLIAASVYFMSRKESIAAQVDHTDAKKDIAKRHRSHSTGNIKQTKIRQYSPGTAKLVLWLFAVAGFTALAYEVIWTRALIFYVSSTTYSFAAILATFLAGIVLGSFFMARRVDRLYNPIFLFGVFQCLIALLALLSIPALKNLDIIQRWMLSYLDINSWDQIIIMLFASAFIILILPTFLMGAAFPVVNRVYVESIPRLGSGVGSVYMANTVGAIAGSFCAGFVLLPHLGIAGSLLLVAGINLLIGITAHYLGDFFIGRTIHKWILSFGFALIFILVAAQFFTVKPLVTGVASYGGARLLYYKDAAAATLAALEKKETVNIWGRNVRYLNINGHNTAHTTFADITIHKMLAHLPMLLHPNPRNVLVVGFGFGSTCQSFLNYDVDQLDCVELLAEEKQTAVFFEPENHHVFADSRFHYIVNDGRNYILGTNRHYDVISVNAVDPKFSPTLYTYEYYELCKGKLNANGLMVAWLPLYGMTPQEVWSLVKSFVDVFPHSSLWYNNPEHLLLLGAREPLTVDLEQIKTRISIPKIKANLAEIKLDNPYSFLATFLFGEKGLTILTEKAKLQRDKFPAVEFSRVTLSIVYPEIYLALLTKKESIWPLCRRVNAFGDSAQTQTEIMRYEQGMFSMLKGLFQYRIAAANSLADSAQITSAYKLMRDGIDRVPENEFNLLFFVDWVQHYDLATARPYFEKAVATEPNFIKAQVLLGLEKAEQEDWDSAIACYAKALAINDRYIAAAFNMGYAYAQKKDWNMAVTLFEQVIMLQPENIYAHSSLGQVYTMVNNLDKAIEHFETAISLKPDEPNFHFNLGMIYSKKSKIADAIRSFEAGLKLAPNDKKARRILQQLKAN